MDDPVHEIRALLMQFVHSPLKHLYVRSDAMTVFMARPGGGDNPMRQTTAAPHAAAVAGLAPALVSVKAPHLGLFLASLAVGDLVDHGGLIGTIDVLGRKTEILSDRAGHIAAIHFAANQLVEFGETLVEIAVAA
ncbi:hypothetical protein [Novosphingobium lentum]|uniref:hypothetical protein n=1 Tax=Novosphingobium lentum TaxID=145287 RepID=UPI00082DF30B|nr:hypothetical protein [Novosphingobium lentum]